MSQGTLFPSPGENPLLDAQLQEAAEVSTFINSPIWGWLKAHLTRKRAALLAKSTLVGGDRPLTTDERMLLLGKLSLLEEVLARPATLMDLLDRRAKADMEAPSRIQPLAGTAPQRASLGLL